MAKNDFQYGGWNYYTLQCGMWHWNHHSEFTKCNVIRGSRMTCHGIRPNVRHIEILHWFITAVDMSFCTSLQNFIQSEQKK